MRRLLVTLWLVLLVSGVGALFWYNQYRYSLPTPVPANYKAVNNGTLIRLPQRLKLNGNKPVFLHFFNPDCPCSRFNITHVKSLIKQYGQQATFVVVLVSNKKYTEQEVQDKFGLDIPVIKDASLAMACGVYSTPQAVILNSKDQLSFRGNYNSTRYCTNKKTEYARQALDKLLHNEPINNNPLATTAYGCRLVNLNPNTYAVQQ